MKSLLYFVYCCLLCICVRCTGEQHAPKNQAQNNKCDSNNQEYLVERFFNLIFSQPQNGPPVCICVQMCPDQPTYCYPSGCMRPAGHIRIPDEGGTRESEKNPFSNMIDAKGPSALNNFMNSAGLGKFPFTVKTHIVTSLPDLIRDRVKILFKYKKIPKIQVRYNLKEQVKHMNIDKQRIDLNYMKKNVNNEEVSNNYFKSKTVRPHISSEDLNFKKFSKKSLSSPVALRKNILKKRDMKENYEELDNLKAAVFLKRNIVPGDETTPVFVYNIIINETKLRGIIENKGVITLDFGQA